MPTKFIALVGACYIDTILETPHYPEEDSKLRAHSISKRRGGNGPNSAEILAQISHLPDSNTDSVTLQPLLISTLPNKKSVDFQFVKDSLPGVNLDHCIHREDKEDVPKSFIIRSQSTNSRTIVNYNDLDEMTIDEFTHVFEEIQEDVRWWHFEGRIPDITMKCVDVVRQRSKHVGISVEVEKPAREGLEELSLLADFVFYSRSWAMNAGFTNLRTFLTNRKQYYLNSPGSQVKRVFCTWGDQGAGTVEVHGSLIVVEPQLSANCQVVDTVGAGDVFIAMTLRSSQNAILDWEKDPSKHLKICVDLCGRKVCQEGFSNLFM